MSKLMIAVLSGASVAVVVALVYVSQSSDEDPPPASSSGSDAQAPEAPTDATTEEASGQDDQGASGEPTSDEPAVVVAPDDADAAAVDEDDAGVGAAGEAASAEEFLDSDAAVADEPIVADVDGDAAAGQRVFARCMACHAYEEGSNRVGPSLFDLWGRAAGTAEGYDGYSEAMTASGIVWTPETLDSYLADVQGTVPGANMAFPGISDPQQRLDLIAYLIQVLGEPPSDSD